MEAADGAPNGEATAPVEEGAPNGEGVDGICTVGGAAPKAEAPKAEPLPLALPLPNAEAPVLAAPNPFGVVEVAAVPKGDVLDVEAPPNEKAEPVLAPVPTVVAGAPKGEELAVADCPKGAGAGVAVA